MLERFEVYIEINYSMLLKCPNLLLLSTSVCVFVFCFVVVVVCVCFILVMASYCRVCVDYGSNRLSM